MNILHEAAIAQATFTAGMNELNDYQTFTTFYSDFTIADYYGVDAVKDTFKRSFDSWKSNYRYMTELAIVLNHKIFEHHYHNHTALMVAYDTLWKEIDQWCMGSFNDEELQYYLRITD